jgi:hypothetical protein
VREEGGGDTRAGAGGGERRDEGGGVREAVGMQTPRGCARGGTCCILQQLLQLLLELLQCPSVLQNEDVDRAAAIVGDSLRNWCALAWKDNCTICISLVK